MVNEIEQSVIQVCYAASHALWPGTYAEHIVLDTLLTQSQDQSHVARLSPARVWTKFEAQAGRRAVGGVEPLPNLEIQH